MKALKFSGQKSRPQVPIDYFIVDFARLSHRLIIEVDVATYATDDARESDFRGQYHFESHGFRCQNMDVFANIDGAMETVVSVVDRWPGDAAPTPGPSPQGGGEFQ
jgi:very-short-patch-repair endonuclease